MNKLNKENVNLWIPTELITNTDISSYTIATYAVLQAIHQKLGDDIICVSPTHLCHYVFQTPALPKSLISKFKLGLDDLIEKQYIKKINSASNIYIVDCTKLNLDYKTQPFAIIKLWELRKLFQLEADCNVFELFRYFVNFAGSISNKLSFGPDEYSRKTRIVGNMTFNWLSKRSGLAERTIYRYNDILENAELIYIEKSQALQVGHDSNGDMIVSTIPYYYGRFVDKEYVKQFASQQNAVGNIIKLSDDVNKKRSLAQKYQMLRQNKENNFDRYEIADIYRYIVSRNAVVMKTYKKKGDESVLKKMSDLSVFEKYGFDTDVNYDEYDEENSL